MYNSLQVRGGGPGIATCRVQGSSGFDRFRKHAFFMLSGLLFVFAAFIPLGENSDNNIYPAINERIVSPENTTYFIDPVKGDDRNNGTDRNSPWRSFKNINSLILSDGNVVKILRAGDLRTSLFVVSNASESSPVKIEFSPGRYDFYPEKAVKRRFFISNTNGAPDSLKSVAFYIFNSKNIRVEGNGAEFIFRGKVMETVIDSSENISINGIAFDYNRPTVSEMKILKVSDNYAIAQIHKDSKYEIKDHTLFWTGEGWRHSVQKLWQIFDPEKDVLFRKNLPVRSFRFYALSPGTVRIDFNSNPGFKKGLIFQNRNTFRDYAAIFTRNSKNILWKDINVYFMHGMGFVSQFTANITFDNLTVAPREGSGRTCAAWADILHFSGCSGEIKILNSYLSAANDDAVNVHGTHLKIIGLTSKNRMKVRYMHPQTYGFYPAYRGDSIEFISAKTLLPYFGNVVTNIKMLNDHEFEFYFKDDISKDVKINDVIENIIHTPDVTIKNTTITHIPTRGVLVTTRRKVVIRGNDFFRTYMSAILISDDANSWFESGYVRNVLIEKNRFIECGKPVINIHPENKVKVKNHFVHSNIRITNNYFEIKGLPVLAVKSTDGLTFTENIIEGTKDENNNDLITFKDCGKVNFKNNKIKN